MGCLLIQESIPETWEHVDTSFHWVTGYNKTRRAMVWQEQ